MVTEHDYIYFLIVTMSLLEYTEYLYLIVYGMEYYHIIVIVISVECVRYCGRCSSYMNLIMDTHVMSMDN